MKTYAKRYNPEKINVMWAADLSADAFDNNMNVALTSGDLLYVLHVIMTFLSL